MPSNQYRNAFNKERYADIKLRIPKSKKPCLDALVECTGKSANRLFIEAVEKVYNIDLTIVEEQLK